ncbi:hypothetical protein [Streptomonospora wellingtoniae]|uniref:C2H2-type domain-containing protein n=1 Tax=Streptomonospora wellingtoniae TaxID=3075544 RepID=A0ABU2KUI6_9ACTN|nr:hypothetical protein [Streptomonospora sp. DSM 45055]MDT0302922.1 hypothetical protein [Streptomonospora sp. DSM 45055]
MTHRPTPPGTSGCICPKCHRVFTRPSTFDKHQDQGGRETVCHDPADRGMEIVRRTIDGHPVWGHPVSDADRDRLARIRKAA